LLTSIVIRESALFIGSRVTNNWVHGDRTGLAGPGVAKTAKASASVDSFYAKKTIFLYNE